jgi:predicted nucleic acid-binding Zn ribbon protein
VTRCAACGAPARVRPEEPYCSERCRHLARWRILVATAGALLMVLFGTLGALGIFG